MIFLSQNDDKIKDIISKSRGQPRRRLQHMYDVAKSKSVCEGGDNFEKKETSVVERVEDALKVVSVKYYIEQIHVHVAFTIVLLICLPFYRN